MIRGLTALPHVFWIKYYIQREVLIVYFKLQPPYQHTSHLNGLTITNLGILARSCFFIVVPFQYNYQA